MQCIVKNSGNLLLISIIIKDKVIIIIFKYNKLLQNFINLAYVWLLLNLSNKYKHPTNIPKNIDDTSINLSLNKLVESEYCNSNILEKIKQTKNISQGIICSIVFRTFF